MKRNWIGLCAFLILFPAIGPAAGRELRLLEGLPVGLQNALPRDPSALPASGRSGDEARGVPIDVQDFGLVSETEGWILGGPHLYWTESGGQDWQDISPVDRDGSTVAAVFFLDASRGWAVTKAAEGAGPADYALARTADGGRSWESSPLGLLSPGPAHAPVGAAYLHFLDASTGWLVARHVSSNNFSLGSLFKTSDGGATWAQLSMPIGDPVFFATEQVGWTAGGAAGDELYRTVDGGASWQPQEVGDGSAPGSPQRFYRLPGFWSAAEGLLPEVVAGEGPRLELYATQDAGAQWELAASVPLPSGITSADGLPLSLVPGARQAMLLQSGDRMVTASAGGGITATPARPGGSGTVTRLNMVTSSVGWAAQSSGSCQRAAQAASALSGSGAGLECRSETRLLGTADGGRTWTPLSLPQTAPPGSVPAAEERPAPAGSGGPGVPVPPSGSRAIVFAGQGFDKCEIASVAQLQQWMAQSPYRAVNLYIGGAARACSNLALSSSLLSTLSQLGWKFIPTWVGPQAPCVTSVKLKMSLDPAVAHAQGIAEANAAADVAAGLGLAAPDGSGAIVYYDMEYYDTTNAACHEAVRAFVSGWTAQMHARGSFAGVYATGAPLGTFTTLPDVLDAIWPANWVASAYDPAATVWDVYRLSNVLWSDHQRIRQYTGGHVETWGSVSLNIDCDVIDGIVAHTALQSFHLYLPLTLHNNPLG
jgi:hypothetical protein